MLKTHCIESRLICYNFFSSVDIITKSRRKKQVLDYKNAVLFWRLLSTHMCTYKCLISHRRPIVIVDSIAIIFYLIWKSSCQVWTKQNTFKWTCKPDFGKSLWISVPHSYKAIFELSDSKGQGKVYYSFHEILMVTISIQRSVNIYTLQLNTLNLKFFSFCWPKCLVFVYQWTCLKTSEFCL